ncbi:MAG: carbonic anhydrase [Burkholderiales bacterium]
MTNANRRLGLLAFTVSILASAQLHAEGEHHWSYSGDTGPAYWAAVEADYGACGLGTLQSPIDIRDSVATKSALPAITFDYKPSALRIIDNGHTIQVDYAPGSFITVEGKRYELVQFHFHKPSEEKINGKKADMVAHLVHKDADGNLAVVAVLLKSGQPNKLVETLWKHLPRQKENEVAVEGVEVNAADLLPPNRAAYYTFAGSLTTPPCSEGVTWFVMKAPSSVSSGEVARFAQLYPMNARPTQPLNGREIRATP